jgi:hypothetical protein
MPEIEQYDWSKLQPEKAERLVKQDFSRFKIKALPKKNKKVVTNKRFNRKRKSTKVKDSRLFNDIYDQDQHLKSI